MSDDDKRILAAVVDDLGLIRAEYIGDADVTEVLDAVAMVREAALDYLASAGIGTPENN
jgi:hypothetical protein